MPGEGRGHWHRGEPQSGCAGAAHAGGWRAATASAAHLAQLVRRLGATAERGDTPDQLRQHVQAQQHDRAGGRLRGIRELPVVVGVAMRWVLGRPAAPDGAGASSARSHGKKTQWETATQAAMPRTLRSPTGAWRARGAACARRPPAAASRTARRPRPRGRPLCLLPTGGCVSWAPRALLPRPRRADSSRHGCDRPLSRESSGCALLQAQLKHFLPGGPPKHAGNAGQHDLNPVATALLWAPKSQ